MKRILAYISTVLALLGPFSALQAATTDIYTDEVPVLDQGMDERSRAFSEALRHVLIRGGGLESVADYPALQQALRSPGRYVRSFRYRNPRSSDRDLLARAGEGAFRQIVTIHIDQEAVEKLFHSEHLIMWGGERPTTLVWLGVSQGRERHLLSSDDKGLVKRVMNDEAGYRGIPLNWPLLDLEEQQQVSASDIWGGFQDNLLQVSERYHAGAVLIGRLEPASGERWQATWYFYHQGQEFEWQDLGDEVESLLRQVVGRVAHHLAMVFRAEAKSGSGQLLINVDGVTDLARYRRVMEHLQRLHGVQSLLIEKVHSHHIDFRLELELGSENVLSQIAQGGLLNKAKGPPKPRKTVVDKTQDAEQPIASGVPSSMVGPRLESDDRLLVGPNPAADFGLRHYFVLP